MNAHPQASSRPPYPINPRVGMQTPATAYTGCQYTYTTTSTNPPKLVHCGEQALLMPGYYRACAQHVLPTLARSVRELLERPTTQRDQRTVQLLTDLLYTLTVSTEEIGTSNE